MKLFFLILFFKFSYLQAHHKIYSPKVEEGRQSFEWRCLMSMIGTKKIKSSSRSWTEYWTSFWQSEFNFIFLIKKILHGWKKLNFRINTDF